MERVGRRASPRDKRPLGEVAFLFLKLGVIGFGGPAAHIALMRQEVVVRRKWVTDQQFLDLVGAANLIPGPSSTEVAIFLGYVRAGWRGLILAGTLFILPAMLIVLAIAWAYVTFGTTPAAGAILYGIKPVIIAIVAQALWGLGRTAIKTAFLGAIGAAVVALYLLGVSPIALIIGGGLLVLAVDQIRLRLRRSAAAIVVIPRVWLGVASAAAAAAVPFSLGTLFLTFLKIGFVVFGSGYVLLAFLRDDLVTRLGWLTDQQLVDAVAVGQITPGPVFTTATFIGYVLGGVPGAILATVGIFLPGFLLVAAIYPLIPRLRASPVTRGLLDGVNVAALGLMAAVTWQLALASIVDPLTGAVAIAAGLVLFRFRPNSALLVLAGAVVGIAHRLVLG